MSGCVSTPDASKHEIPGTTYECVALREGRHVLVGTAGRRDGESVLLIHGLGANAHWDWRNVVPELAPRFRVVTLDLPGFGASAPVAGGYSFETLAAVLADVLDHEGIERANVVGHSLGGAVALYFAHTHPGRTQRLVLVDAAGMLLKSVYVQHVSKVTTPRLGLAPADRLLNAIDNRINGLNRHLTYRLESTFDFSAWLAANPSIRNSLLGRFTQTDAALGLIERDFTQAIRETQAPTTVIWGRNDDVSPVRVGELLAGRLPSANLHVIERVGHVPMNEATREFNELLLQALHDPPRVRAAAEESNTGVDVRCKNESGRRYSGVIASITLENCRDVRIEDAQIAKLVATNSSVSLVRVWIDGGELALDAHNSFITATVLRVDASDTALRLDDSTFDFAGASIRAGKRGIAMTAPSAIYFSVSDMQAPEYSGDLHRIWDMRAMEAQAPSR
jgi:pimeloyl-ACP methyl ester carboxylesterase